jgi:hydroxyacylglutathione hydrolase
MIYPVMGKSVDSNCYLIKSDKVAVIDAGIDPTRVLEKIDELGVDVDFLVNTHCHYDHVGGNLLVKEKTNARICVHELDAGFMEKGDGRRILADLFGSGFLKVKPDLKLTDGQIIDLGGVKLEVVHTPGHTPGSICLYESKSKSLFSGDTIFSNGIGRTDLPGGDWKALRKSVEKLLNLHRKEGVEKIYPGHGPAGRGDDIEKIYLAYFRMRE